MGFFGTILAPVENLLQFVLESLHSLTDLAGVGSYGLAIILLTVIIKMLLYPLTVKQVKSMKAMQELSPKMKKIQEKYKDNPQVMQQKVGALYKEAGVNPLAGCLPLLIQMPILIGIFYGIRDFQYAGSPLFMGLDISRSLSEFMSAGGPEMYAYAVLPVLSALTTFLQSKMTMPDTSTTQNQVMLYGMPLFIGYISISFPTGLVLYWVVMNIMQIGQQLFMERGQKK